MSHFDLPLVGFVEFYHTYEMPPSGTLLHSLRNNSRYKRGLFSQSRSHEFVYMPNCDSYRYHENLAGTTNTTQLPCRLSVMITLPTAASVLVEYVWFGELTSERVQSVHTARDLSVDAPVVKSAIPKAFSEGQTLQSAVVEQKIESHPILKKIGGLAEAGLAGVGGWESVATALALL